MTSKFGLALAAVVLFILDALQVPTPRLNKVSAAWACVVAAFFF